MVDYQFGKKGRRNTDPPKPLIIAQIHTVSSGGGKPLKATFSATASCQGVMAASTGNFQNQGGASWDAVISPFQIDGGSTELPTMPTSAEAACVVSQSNQVDPPIDDWTPPIIDISYLNPFKRTSDPVHGQGNHYDGTILYNGSSSDRQNLPNLLSEGFSFPTDIRPIALRGPLVIQGWGYDLNGKPIPNKVDDETDAQAGTFESGNLKDEFLQNWIEKRQTWPVAPVDLRYDRVRKVWTIPNTFRIIQATGHNDGIAPGEAKECDPANIGDVYKSDGTKVNDPKVTVTNPPWAPKIESGQVFFAFYDTRDCTYYPMTSSGTGTGGPPPYSTGAEYKDLAYCGYTPSPSYCTKIECLKIGTGLKLDGDILNADHIISDAAYCDHVPTVTDQFFNKLVYGEGLQVEDEGDCEFTIKADHRITDLSYCDHVPDAAVEDKFFRHLKFGQGLKVFDNGDCEYEIYAKHQIADDPYCDYTPTIPERFFNKLTFGRGLQVTDDDPLGDACDYTINADNRIRDVRSDPCDPAATVIAWKQYSKLSMGNGLTVTQTTDGCEYKIDAADVKIGLTGGGVYAPVRTLKIGSGLGLIQDPDPLKACDYTLIGSGTGGGGATCHTTVVATGGSDNSVTVTSETLPDGCIRYNISGAPTGDCGATQSVPYVSDILCVGSGLEIVTSYLGFHNGCFTGAWASE